MSAAQAAELAIAARFKITPGAGSAVRVAGAADAQARMLDALERYDEASAEQVLEKLQATFSATIIIRDVFLPLLREVGERWVGTRLSVAQEHFVSGFIHSRLLGLARGWDRGLGPRPLLACPAHEQHTFGLIAFGIALHRVGWRIIYLGADTPIPIIAEAAAQVRPRLTVISTVVPERLEHILPELSDLNSRWPLAFGGAGCSREVAERCGALPLAGDPVTAAASVFG